MTSEIKRLLIVAIGSTIIGSATTAKIANSSLPSLGRFQGIPASTGQFPALYVVDTTTGAVHYYLNNLEMKIELSNSLRKAKEDAQ